MVVHAESWCLWYEKKKTCHRKLILHRLTSLGQQVSTAEKAREVVADSRFPPVGRRGFGSPFTHGVWGVTTSEYLESANRDILVMVQIENKEAVQNIHAIAEVEGIGLLFHTINALPTYTLIALIRCSVHWSLRSIDIPWLSNTIP